MNNYDIIIIGGGAGGGTLALKLAPSGKKILILERGDYLPREKENWNATEVFVKNRYVSKDIWHDKDNKPFQPGSHYFVGGATKMYGAAMFRLRKEDFSAHKTAAMMNLNRITRRPKNFTTSTASAAMIRPIRRRARRIRFRLLPTSRAFRNSPII